MEAHYIILRFVSNNSKKVQARKIFPFHTVLRKQLYFLDYCAVPLFY